MEPIVKTNAVAADMLIDVSSFFETPMNGQSPKIFVNTILLTKTTLMMIKKYSVIYSIILFKLKKLSKIYLKINIIKKNIK
jgi:hypothetical protein